MCDRLRRMSINVVPYDQEWPHRFEAERMTLKAALTPWLTDGVHHIGSTSVPGLAASPWHPAGERYLICRHRIRRSDCSPSAGCGATANGLAASYGPAELLAAWRAG